MAGSVPEGGCRLCVVEVEGGERPVAACHTPAAAGQVSANRKKFRGVLERAEAVTGADGTVAEAGWQIVWRDEPTVKPGQKISKKRPLAPLQALGFDLSEIRDARLAPIVSFKGRGTSAGNEPASDTFEN